MSNAAVEPSSLSRLGQEKPHGAATGSPPNGSWTGGGALLLVSLPWIG